MLDSVAKNRNGKLIIPKNYNPIMMGHIIIGISGITHGFFDGKSINLAKKIEEAAISDGA